jgi:hypothetical protein
VHEIRDLLVAVRSGAPASPSFDDGLAVQRVLSAIETSAELAGAGVIVSTTGAEMGATAALAPQM